MLKKYELSEKEFVYARIIKKIGIKFLASVFDLKSLKLVKKLV